MWKKNYINQKNIFYYEIILVFFTIIGYNIFFLFFNRNERPLDFGITKEDAKLEEEKYPYIEENLKYKNYDNYNKLEKNIIVGIDFGFINSGYSYMLGNDITEIRINKKNTNEFELLRHTLKGKHYSSTSSISMMNYRNKELNNIIYIKGIKSLLYSENKKFNDNIFYIYPNYFVHQFNITDSLKEYFLMLKNDIIKEINENVELELMKILWVISIPSTWKEFEKQLFKNALIKSGINNIKLIYESEAASLAMYYDTTIQDKFKKKNKIFMLVDAGGNSIDITVNEIIDRKGGIKEIINTTSDNIGISNITEQIIKILEEIYDKSYIDNIKDYKPGEWIKILKDINQAIENTYSINAGEVLEINILYKKAKKNDIYIYSFQNKKYEIEYNQFSLYLPSDLIGIIILNNIYYIKHNIDEVINEIKIKNLYLDSIMITGGFSQNKIFKNEIINYYYKENKINVNFLSSYQTSISKGSVIYGTDINKIKERISPITIGIKNKSDKGKIELLIKKGDVINNSLFKIKLIRPVLKNQKIIQFNIYTSSEDVYNDNEFENKFFGRLLLKIDKKNRGIIQLYIIYDTCLSFYAYNYENGNEINTEFQYFK